MYQGNNKKEETMPRVDIWIKVEDWEKWKAIKDKPKWLHEHIQGVEK